MSSGFKKGSKRFGIVVIGLAVLALVLGRGLGMILRHRPKHVLGMTRKLFGRGLNPVWLWLVDRFHLDQPVVYHVGRKSGREYATPLCVSPTPEGFIVPAAFGPDVDWLANLRATPRTRLVYGGVTYPVTAEVIDSEEAIRIAGGHPGCPCWQEYRVQELVLLRPDGEQSAQPEKPASPLTGESIRSA